MASEKLVAQRLIELVGEIGRTECFPAYQPEASGLAATNPFASALAVSLQRGVSAEIIWTIAYDLREALGHLDPARVAEMSLEELDYVFVAFRTSPGTSTPHRGRWRS
ncbi:MAG: hypothetical protein MUQ10_09630 [Anaerolineae bacterium]|nr:hypothetical protein [Anaerolineae bacterium]